jgi:transcriptional regulator with XRE-family HTH domain
MSSNNHYWGLLIAQLRQHLNWTQEQLAERLATDQATVSRWENGAAVPRQHIRQQLDELAKEAGLATAEELAAVIRASPFPMILTNRDSMVVAASPCSGFQEGSTCLEQTPKEEQANLLAFQQALEQAGFWEQHCPRQDYAFEIGDEHRKAIVMPVTLRGVIYALVQKNA